MSQSSATSLGDRDLWRASADGNCDAFAELFHRHVRAVYNACFRRTANWVEAEDLTAQAFLEAWRRREDVHLQSESVLPWLLGTVVNLDRNRVRGLARRDRVIRAGAWPEAVPDFADDVAQQLEDESSMRAALEVLSQLPAQDRDVVHLCVWSGLSYSEAAAALDVPVGTVKSRLSRAKERLRAGLISPSQATPDSEVL